MVQGLQKGPTLKFWCLVKCLNLNILIAEARISLISTMSRPVLEPTKPRIQRIQWALFTR